jgi:hypothetical protein
LTSKSDLLVLSIDSLFSVLWRMGMPDPAGRYFSFSKWLINICRCRKAIQLSGSHWFEWHARFHRLMHSLCRWSDWQAADSRWRKLDQPTSPSHTRTLRLHSSHVSWLSSTFILQMTNKQVLYQGSVLGRFLRCSEQCNRWGALPSSCPWAARTNSRLLSCACWTSRWLLARKICVAKFVDSAESRTFSKTGTIDSRDRIPTERDHFRLTNQDCIDNKSSLLTSRNRNFLAFLCSFLSAEQTFVANGKPDLRTQSLSIINETA